MALTADVLLLVTETAVTTQERELEDRATALAQAQAIEQRRRCRQRTMRRRQSDFINSPAHAAPSAGTVTRRLGWLEGSIRASIFALGAIDVCGWLLRVPAMVAIRSGIRPMVFFGVDNGQGATLGHRPGRLR